MSVKNPSGGLTNWMESETLYSGKYYTRFIPASTQTNKDAVVSPLGTGGFSLQQPDGTAAGGNARGAKAKDFGLIRSAFAQVASGTGAINLSDYGTSSGNYSFNSATNGVANNAYATNGMAYGIASGIGAVNFCYDGTASGNYSFASGNGVVAICFSEKAHGSGYFTNAGDAQRRELVIRANTTSATPVTLTADGNVIGTQNQLILQNNQSLTVQVLVVAKKSGTTASTSHFRLTVCASRGASAATTVLHTAPVIETLWNPDGAVIAATVDTTNGGITFTVTTPAGNWHTVADVFAISTIFA